MGGRGLSGEGAGRKPWPAPGSGDLHCAPNGAEELSDRQAGESVLSMQCTSAGPDREPSRSGAAPGCRLAVGVRPSLLHPQLAFRLWRRTRLRGVTPLFRTASSRRTCNWCVLDRAGSAFDYDQNQGLRDGVNIPAGGAAHQGWWLNPADRPNATAASVSSSASRGWLRTGSPA
jgi:hypothetical protein